ncbi:MAG: AEC family transporter [Eubacteriales bacterium]|nr:AEC family transporter [Eubacteriales bacterium]
MTEAFIYSWQVIAPILLMVVAGYVAKRILPMDTDFYKLVNKLCFRIFLPTSLFCNVYRMQAISEVNGKVLLFVIFAILLTVVLGMVVAHFIPERDQKGVMVQVAFRSNNMIMGIYIASALGGAAAESFAVSTVAISVCLFNILAVIVLEYYAGSESRGIKQTLEALIKNPLLIAILLGFLCVFIRNIERSIFGDTPFTLQNNLPSVYKLLTDFSKVATPVMIFNLGALLDFGATKAKLNRIIFGVCLRLLIAPAICLLLAVLLRNPLEITSVEYPALIAVFTTPAAVSGSVMVAEIGGDSQLASQIIIWSTAFSMVTMFLFIFAFRLMGLI